ncbi:hypothetical protein EVAR_94962_1 [Eumeta japonica]|uniref:Paramyosin n=1 Tax=Eumeta variegata TaxID=151549 RepID=A0A4C1UUZ5_EUMVA|nr:hypothetical protein EVAR_94962_1 [Eumeta japonica]
MDFQFEPSRKVIDRTAPSHDPDPRPLPFRETRLNHSTAAAYYDENAIHALRLRFHEDIRDAMLSLVHMFRTSEDKLERHEYREKALGDQLKKMVSGLEKKHRALEPLKGMISRLDERLSNVETILMQKEEREKSVQQKTNEALTAIQASLQSITASLPKPKKNGGLSAIDNLTTNDDGLATRLDVTDSKLDAIKREVDDLKNNLNKESLKAICLDIMTDTKPFEKHISDAEKLLSKYELKLSEYNVTIGRGGTTDFVPLNEIALSDEAWHSKMAEVMEKQEKDVKNIQKLLSDAESIWKGLPRLADLNEATNKTIAALQEVKYNIISNEEKGVSKLTTKLREMSDKLLMTNEDIQKSLTEGNTMTERVYGDISRSYEALRTEVQALSKMERVMVRTADNVIDTKRRVEYGVHQILVEVGELVKIQHKTINKTIHEKFDNLELSILKNQTTSIANLSSTIEESLSQIWRQIGIMYQQLTASKTSLDNFMEQTELYVNGSTTTMDNMKAKVGLITSRMSEVDDNLNYLLGRLSLVTQEFNRIKTELGEALDKVKGSFLSVQTKLAEAGPGPHKITSSETTV